MILFHWPRARRCHAAPGRRRPAFLALPSCSSPPAAAARGVTGQSSGARRRRRRRRSPSAGVWSAAAASALVIFSGGAAVHDGQDLRRRPADSGGDGGRRQARSGPRWAWTGPAPDLLVPRLRRRPRSSWVPLAAQGHLGHLSRIWWWWPSHPSEMAGRRWLI
jgi:hypothetical protein